MREYYHNPDEVYIIARVFNADGPGGPKVRYFVDPHALIVSGALRVGGQRPDGGFPVTVCC